MARDYPVILINLQNQLNTLLRKNKAGVTFLERISVNPEACRNNFEKNSKVILAEPLYIALQMAGYVGDAHELVNHQIVPAVQSSTKTMTEVLKDLAQGDNNLQKIVNDIPREVLELLSQPGDYIGDAKEKTQEVIDYAKNIINKIK